MIKQLTCCEQIVAWNANTYQIALIPRKIRWLCVINIGAMFLINLYKKPQQLVRLRSLFLKRRFCFRPPITQLRAESSLDSPNYDSLILVVSPDQKISSNVLSKAVLAALELDPALKTELALLPVQLPAKRFVYSPTGMYANIPRKIQYVVIILELFAGPVDPDYDDVRVFQTAGAAGIRRALKAGSKKPLLVLEENQSFANGPLVTLLEVLRTLYTVIRHRFLARWGMFFWFLKMVLQPLEVREHDPSKTQKVDYLGVWTNNEARTQSLIQLATVIESGKRVAYDIGGADPERWMILTISSVIYSMLIIVMVLKISNNWY